MDHIEINLNQWFLKQYTYRRERNVQRRRIKSICILHIFIILFTYTGMQYILRITRILAARVKIKYQQIQDV